MFKTQSVPGMDGLIHKDQNKLLTKEFVVKDKYKITFKAHSLDKKQSINEADIEYDQGYLKNMMK